MSKIALMSGKLSGTKTFESTLDEKESLDDVETFLNSLKLYSKLLKISKKELIELIKNEL